MRDLAISAKWNEVSVLFKCQPTASFMTQTLRAGAQERMCILWCFLTLCFSWMSVFLWGDQDGGHSIEECFDEILILFLHIGNLTPFVGNSPLILPHSLTFPLMAWMWPGRCWSTAYLKWPGMELRLAARVSPGLWCAKWTQYYNSTSSIKKQYFSCRNYILGMHPWAILSILWTVFIFLAFSFEIYSRFLKQLGLISMYHTIPFFHI